ncbi:3-oxoacyl-(acyl-carrier-protein) synthase 2 [Neobacillus bataviensis LMG 21833]|uniref:3-oxoacyl-(Acyl-carrier-protein) synthase 2 n=1 Tax=Neobacillus bataviensis LMG 21833 TaxID=1117379 RepID=K6DYD8_9BACI|nr:3-oxoacyl-(acyl-carrier-protein) synthase 2 [Neobacillus bataviensis LMG 21833]
MAALDAGIQIGEDVQPERVGVWIRSGIGGLAEFEEQHRRFIDKGQRRVNPFYNSYVYPGHGGRTGFY